MDETLFDRPSVWCLCLQRSGGRGLAACLRTWPISVSQRATRTPTSRRSHSSSLLLSVQPRAAYCLSQLLCTNTLLSRRPYRCRNRNDRWTCKMQ